MANKTLSRRLDALEAAASEDRPERLPLVVPAATSDAELRRLRESCGRRLVYRDGDPALFDLFV